MLRAYWEKLNWNEKKHHLRTWIFEQVACGKIPPQEAVHLDEYAFEMIKICEGKDKEYLLTNFAKDCGLLEE